MPTDAAYLSIGEVAKLTGVNPITLRAWQRRFGLVIPARTPKGHRLYSDAQVLQIKEILSWLERGVAISKVKPLLDGGMSDEHHSDDDWQTLATALTNAVMELNAAYLQQRLDESCSLYPQPILNRYLREWLVQLQTQLALRVDGALLSNWCQSELTQWLSLRASKLLSQKPPYVLLCRLGAQSPWSEWLLTLELVLSGRYPQQFGEIANLDSLLLLQPRLQVDAALIQPAADSSHKLVTQAAALKQQLGRPVLLVGEFAPMLVAADNQVIDIQQAQDDAVALLNSQLPARTY
ncbi:MerR family transcriptional regulator [Shewanella sp. A32]|uniref:MerR family transcriptional regulator n=1 Tax=Shewanella sp. A32 TaxID=3031327 RepID=UPI0023B8936D|nr:MerR family transcriptional regulator [Shewanella sp. A32]MDF0533897.1 MerR family transcriptional regulator [Shewanella sp. A32]